MKIIHVLPALTKGGAEKVVVDLANATSLLGHDVTVLVGYEVDPMLLKNSLLNTVKFLSIYDVRHSKFLNYILLTPWILKNWKFISTFDVLHCHLSMGAVFGSLVYIFRFLLPVTKMIIIETNHSVGMPLKFIQKMAFYFQCKFRNGYVLMARNSLWTNVLKNNKKLLTEFIPNGIELFPVAYDLKQKFELKNKVGFTSDNVKIIGNIGRLVADRKPFFLLDIFSKIIVELSDSATVNFVMGGEGPEKRAIQERLISLGIEDIVYLPGLINNPLLVMSSMDLYISLNVGQVTGVAGIEAASQGVPVIALQMSSDYTPTDSDWIWSSTDPTAVALKACEIIKDDILRTNIAKSQRNYVVNNFDAKKMAENYIYFYVKVAENMLIKF